MKEKRMRTGMQVRRRKEEEKQARDATFAVGRAELIVLQVEELEVVEVVPESSRQGVELIVGDGEVLQALQVDE